MTRKDYDVEHLVRLLQGLKGRYSHLQIILEPGSAFTWQTGVLSSEIVDIVENRGIRTAILNVSFTCTCRIAWRCPISCSAWSGDG